MYFVYDKTKVISFVQYGQSWSHIASGLIKNCHIATSMSNSPKCGVVAKFKSLCYEKNDMVQSYRIFVFLASWQNRNDSYFQRITTKIASNREKSQQKIMTKINAISHNFDLIQFLKFKFKFEF